MWKKLAFAVLAVVVLLGLVVAVALKDTPARAAIGERQVVGSDDLEIHYFTSGPADGIPVALLASYARSISDFNELVAQLNSAGYRTIAMQPRGIDGSSLPDLNTTYHDYARDLLAVVEAEGINKPVLIIGHAYGNRIARTFARNYPERVQGLMLLSAGGEEPTPPDVSTAIVKSLFGIFPQSTREQSVQFAFFAKGNTPPDYWYLGWYPMAGLAMGNATAGTPFEEWGDGGSTHMIVLQPKEDAASIDGGAKLQQRFPQRVTLHDIEHAGHALLPEQPEQVTALILQGLTQLASTGD